MSILVSFRWVDATPVVTLVLGEKPSVSDHYFQDFRRSFGAILENITARKAIELGLFGSRICERELVAEVGSVDPVIKLTAPTRQFPEGRRFRVLLSRVEWRFLNQ